MPATEEPMSDLNYTHYAVRRMVDERWKSIQHGAVAGIPSLWSGRLRERHARNGTVRWMAIQDDRIAMQQFCGD